MGALQDGGPDVSVCKNPKAKHGNAIGWELVTGGGAVDAGPAPGLNRGSGGVEGPKVFSLQTFQRGSKEWRKKKNPSTTSIN